MGRRIFLTGGSGFIGSALLRALAEDHDVRAMARSESSAASVSSLGAVPVRCSLEDVGPEHVGDAEVVVHCAAEVSEWAPMSRYRSTNVDGTRRILAAAAGAGAHRFIHMSSDSVLFSGRDLVDVDETTPLPPDGGYGYSDTKREAERLVLAASQPGFETVAVRPVLVWGEGDKTVLPIVTEMIDAGSFLWVDKGSLEVTTTHIDNVVAGTLLAVERGRPGGVYFLTDGPPVAMRDFLAPYVATTGRTVPSRSLPAPVVRSIGSAVERIWSVLRPGHAPPIGREAAAVLSSRNSIRSVRSGPELGYEPVITREEGLSRLSG